MPLFAITEKRPSISIFKLGGAYYFKYFFDDPELFRELEPYYEKARYRFRMATAGERNTVMMTWRGTGRRRAQGGGGTHKKMTVPAEGARGLEMRFLSGAVFNTGCLLGGISAPRI